MFFAMVSTFSNAKPSIMIPEFQMTIYWTTCKAIQFFEFGISFAFPAPKLTIDILLSWKKKKCLPFNLNTREFSIRQAKCLSHSQNFPMYAIDFFLFFEWNAN